MLHMDSFMHTSHDYPRSKEWSTDLKGVLLEIPKAASKLKFSINDSKTKYMTITTNTSPLYFPEINEFKFKN